MPKEQKTSTREFKIEAARLVQTSGKSMNQGAQDLGIAESTFYHWCKQSPFQEEHPFPGSGHQQPHEEELRRLKKELELVRQERDLLKKALGIFSRQQP